MKKQEQESVYGQLALDFGAAIAADEPGEGDCKIIPISAARTVHDAVNRRGDDARSKFTAFFKDSGGFWRSVFDSLDNLEVAEKEIYEGMRRYPNRAHVVDRVFGALCATRVLRSIGHIVYEAHIRELINRAGEGDEDLTVATDAEVIAGIHGVTLITPTKRFVGQGYWHLFQKMLPRQAATLRNDMEPMFSMPTTEYEKEQVFDFIAEIRKKLNVPSRALSTDKRRVYDMSLTLRRFYRKNRRYAPPGFADNDQEFKSVHEVAA